MRTTMQVFATVLAGVCMLVCSAESAKTRNLQHHDWCDTGSAVSTSQSQQF